MQAGGNINDFQAKTFARIQLSKSGEYYPGTAERTLLVSGHLKQITAALDLIFAKLQREGVAPVTPRSRAVVESRDPEADPPPVHLAVKLLVPQNLCGIIIGKHGATVRTYSNDTSTLIRVTAPEGPAIGLNHRVVTINGAPENCLKAIALLTLKQAEDPKYSMYSELPGSYSSNPPSVIAAAAPTPYAAAPYLMTAAAAAPSAAAAAATQASSSPPHHMYHPHHHMYAHLHAQQPHAMISPSSADGIVTLIMSLPDDQATIVIGGGRGSGGIRDIEMMSQVRIRVDRGGERGGGMATVTVTGPQSHVDWAYYLIFQRLNMVVMMHHQQQHQQQQYQQHAGVVGYSASAGAGGRGGGSGVASPSGGAGLSHTLSPPPPLQSHHQYQYHPYGSNGGGASEYSTADGRVVVGMAENGNGMSQYRWQASMAAGNSGGGGGIGNGSTMRER